MKRQAALVTLGLLAGLGLGYAVGLRTTPTGAAPIDPSAAAPAPAPVAQRSGHARFFKSDEVPDRPTLETAKRTLSDWVANNSGDQHFGEIVESLKVWSDSDPQAALAFVLSAPRFPRRNFALSVPLAKICQRDPAQVIAWLHANIPEQERGEIAERVIGRICQVNPREALVLAEADETPVGRHSFAQIFQQLVRLAPGEALAAFNRLSDGGREMTAHSIARAWVETDPVAAFRWVESLRGQPGEGSAKKALLSSLVETDLDQALALMRQWNLGDDDTSQLFHMVAYRKPEEVLNRLGEFPAAQRGEILAVALGEQFSTAPDRMAAIARANLPAPEAASLVANAWGSWLNHDRPAAEAWAATVQDSSLRSGLELAKLRDSARTDPNLFLSSIANQPDALASEKPLIHSALAQLNPDVASAWIARHPGVVNPQFVAAAAAGFFEWNRDEAILWAHSLPPGETQNRALASIASQWTDSGDATRAASTIAAITDPRLQTGTRFQVFTTLYRKDRTAAVQWLAAQPVTPEIRANWETLASTTESGSAPALPFD